MKNINDGGPAFPLPNHTRNWDKEKEDYIQDTGMTLRDYFAAKAMQALLREAGPKDGYWEVEANAAYEIADAMLTAREAA